MNILALNAGSSSLKFRLYRMQEGSAEAQVSAIISAGMVERIGTAQATLRISYGEQPERTVPVGAKSISDAAERVLDQILNNGNEDNSGPIGGGDVVRRVDAIGYRIVHGGNRFAEATRITPDVLSHIRALGELAPLHNPAECDVIEAVQQKFPQIPSFAVFDTAFHRTLPSVAYHYALPDSLSSGYPLRRYGFHGISYRYVSEQFLKLLGCEPVGTRLLVCHLGSGASVCALRDGQSVDTSMGLTPMEGLVMGTRCGDVDAGLLLYLQREKRMSTAEIEDLLDHRSGLLGVSGISADVRDLEKASAAGDSKAILALDLFAYRVRKYIGAYAAALGGLDGVAFTGGIGEHSATMRSRICNGLEFLGIVLDAERNRAADGKQPAKIGRDEAHVASWVIPTDEEQQIARETWQALRAVSN